MLLAEPFPASPTRAALIHLLTRQRKPFDHFLTGYTRGPENCMAQDAYSEVKEEQITIEREAYRLDFTYTEYCYFGCEDLKTEHKCKIQLTFSKDELTGNTLMQGPEILEERDTIDEF